MTLYAHRTGTSGRPVVLLHPLALSGAVWDPVARFLGGTHQVLALDARGHGQSPWDGKDFTVEDMAADAAEVIEGFDAGPADVIGLSMGGSTALVLAATRPDLVHNLVLADGTACYGPDREQVWAERAERAVSVPRVKQLEFQRDRWFAEQFREQHPEEVERVCDIFLATDSQAHAAACRALGALDATSLLGEVRAETLVLVGEEDYATPPEMARELAAGIKGAQLRVLERTRHLSLLERADLWPDVATHLGS
ncbi:alpha/beta fold hydrolase [Amycolatopsis acidiphila]|uniref:Alpha/beta fold hydrolase n=1 Tax=Amycolatopsis acidiphila TaxID=715473 RepID=A0A558A209_9PSEU|nr:alpha/beta fold hydrolase [Amycolatopsis acidiphila]TVT18293.1 alpha/beta fold hydrolase [Amycolatopsis acidiphila]UIJ57942.1 alpha/beta fold hydrolase [Amycolatopsis acidiphila]GHG70992.1 lactone hydrolase [Amycolatopsis acidiphila]